MVLQRDQEILIFDLVEDIRRSDRKRRSNSLLAVARKPGNHPPPHVILSSLANSNFIRNRVRRFVVQRLRLYGGIQISSPPILVAHALEPAFELHPVGDRASFQSQERIERNR